MKIFRTTLAGAALLLGQAANAGDLSLGVGLGGSYSGLGFNIALRSENDLKYVSLGCTSVVHYSSDGTHAACGPGLGWWKTGLIAEGNRHALGVYFGPVDVRAKGFREIKPLYGIGLGYGYYFKGIDRPGFNVGFMPTLSRDEGKAQPGLMLGFGYQF